ncbi:AAA family ATPase [Teredinibacter waterburyi]|uniref:AAA family ATPase n=1 Tax=Teredinibacter waterburyi TaxID=1500538 RepID=UPI00165F09E8|nr:AAA family ATPase [Teredinibacter waterburyi]
MPFINERLKENQELSAREQYLKAAARGSRFKFDPARVAAKLRAKIVGQDAVMSAMEDMLFQIKADFTPAKRPLSVNFFLGPTGVGKTETVRVLAESILGDAEKWCRIDMNTLALEHYAAALTGSPPGYVGSKEGTTLFDEEAIKGSFSIPGIVLFDEIEKASNEVIRALLNVLDTGKLILSAGNKTIDFSNCIIFMTSNIGAQELQQHHQKAGRNWLKRLGFKLNESETRSEHKILQRAMQKKFDPEFINRLDRIIAYNYLATDSLELILDIELTKLNKRLERKNAVLILNQAARNQLYSYYNQDYGARNLAQQMRIKLEPQVARAILEHDTKERFTAGFCGNAFVVEPTDERK